MIKHNFKDSQIYDEYFEKSKSYIQKHRNPNLFSKIMRGKRSVVPV